MKPLPHTGTAWRTRQRWGSPDRGLRTPEPRLIPRREPVKVAPNMGATPLGWALTCLPRQNPRPSIQSTLRSARKANQQHTRKDNSQMRTIHATPAAVLASRLSAFEGRHV